MKQFDSIAPRAAGGAATHQSSHVAAPSTLKRQLDAFQATAGNAAVAAAIRALTVQRQGAAGGSEPQPQGQPTAPNPMIAALWKASVMEPLHTAADAMSDEQPEYRAAFDDASRASGATETALGGLPEGDPRRAKANYLIDDIRMVQVVLAPRAQVEVIHTSDADIAGQLGKLEWDAAVVGESLGGDPAPRATVVPGLGEQEGSGGG